MYLELIAILESLSYINSVDSNNFVILSDSKSALQHLARCSSTFRDAPIAYAIMDSIRNLKNKYNKNVVLQWIPAHIGLIGNEVVDRLAEKASVEGILFNCETYFTDIIFSVKVHCRNLWKEFFDERSLSRGIWYKTIQSQPSGFTWIDGANMSRSEIVIALRLRSGHILLNSFGYLMGKASSSHCSVCGVREDPVHIITECVRNFTFTLIS